MNDGKIIIDKIIAEAEEVAKASLAKGQKEADAVLKAAQEKVNKATAFGSSLPMPTASSVPARIRTIL